MSDTTQNTDDALSIGQLAELGGVNRRTVRYYVQRGLLEAPLGAGRGSHYTRAHLHRLIRIRELQEAGVSLADIPALLDGSAAETPTLAQVPRARRLSIPWRRLLLADGVELHVRDGVLDPARLARLARLIDQTLSRDPEPPTPDSENDDDR